MGLNAVFCTKDIFVCFVLVLGIVDYLDMGTPRNLSLQIGLLRICHLEKKYFMTVFH